MSQILTGLDDSAVDTSANDMILAKDIADTLNSHYPGHLWAVHVDGKGGVVNIHNLLLSGSMGYRIKLVDLFTASDMKHRVKIAGGEILERYQLTRGRLSEQEYAGLATNHAGDFRFDN